MAPQADPSPGGAPARSVDEAIADRPELAPDGPARTWRAAAFAFAAAAAATWALAASWRPMPLVHAAGWLVTGLVALPLLFTGALAGVAACLSVLLTALSLPHLLLRRPTGLGAALAAAWGLPRGILPGYLAALRRVRRPQLWGAAAGFVVGTVAYVATRGFHPPGA